MPKFTSAERILLESIVATLSIKKSPQVTQALDTLTDTSSPTQEEIDSSDVDVMELKYLNKEEKKAFEDWSFQVSFYCC